MSAKYHLRTKTLGHRAAQLFTELNEQRRTTFTLADVGLITSLLASESRKIANQSGAKRP